jgi:transaldolase
MYNAFDMSRDSVECHVQILAASLRSTQHLHGAIARGADIITAPLQILRQWKESASERFASKHTPSPANLKPIPYISIQLVDDYAQYPIDQHPDGLLAQGLSTFASDWNAVVAA